VELRQLESFYWIARLGTFAAAAEKLHTSQPTISMRVRQLERELGVKLFDTKRRSALLTSKGSELVDHAERLLASASDVRRSVGRPETLSGRVRIGVTETIALTWLPQFVGRMNECYPHVVLELDVDLTMNLWEKLKTGSVDIALLPGPVLELNQVSVGLGHIQYMWMSSPRLGLPEGTLGPADLQSHSVLSLASGSTLYGSLERWFRDNGAKARRINVCNSLSVIASLTEAGLGVSLLPPSIYADAIQTHRLRAIEVEPSLAPLEFLAVYPERTVSPLPAVVVEVASASSTFMRACVDSTGVPTSR